MESWTEHARIHGFPYAAHMARAERYKEIVAAHRQYGAAVEAARKACGLRGLEKQSDEAAALSADLRRRVATTPARTIKGLLAKIAATASVLGTESLDESVVCFEEGDPVDVEGVTLSILRDWARMAPSEAANA